MKARCKLWNLHYGFIIVPPASNYIHPSTLCILNIFITVPCAFKYIHSLQMKTKNLKIPDFLITSTVMAKDFALGNSNLAKLDYGLNVLPENEGPKMSVTQMIKNQSRQIFELTANMCCLKNF